MVFKKKKGERQNGSDIKVNFNLISQITYMAQQQLRAVWADIAAGNGHSAGV